MKKFLCLMMLLSLVTTSAFGQETIRRKNVGPRRQLATIVFAGLGGAILGLSTLSFYGRPQEKLVNIAIGFAAGVISGTIYVTFKSATTKDYYDEKPQTDREVRLLDQDLQNLQGLQEIEVFEEPKFQWAPLVSVVPSQTDANKPSTVLGGQVAFYF